MNPEDTTTPKSFSPRTKSVLVSISIIGTIIIGALLIYGILITPSKQPYRDALAQYENVSRANAMLTQAGTSLNASGATDEEFEKNVNTAKDALKSLRVEQEALGKETVLNEGEGKVVFDAFDEKFQAYLEYNENLLDTMPKVRPVLFDCNNIMVDITEDAESAAAVRTCAANLKKLSDIKDTDYKVLVAELQVDYAQLATTLEAMAAVKDPEGADASQYQTLSSQRDQDITELANTGADFSRSVQQHRKEILTTDTADNLEKYLNAKSRIF